MLHPLHMLRLRQHQAGQKGADGFGYMDHFGEAGHQEKPGEDNQHKHLVGLDAQPTV
ncbi:hypothetical protein D3C75_1163060 [compost metagenome]